MVNGLIVQKKQDILYQGVDGENWYLNYLYPEIFKSFFDSNIDRSWCDDQFVDVCNDVDFLHTYVNVSQNNGISCRLILCETDRVCPDGSGLRCINTKFLGFDYAYAGGSYYSAVYNDICSGRFDEFKKYKLNRNGLFEKVDDLTEFIDERKRMLVDKKILEVGDFITYKLFDVETIIK